MSSFVELELTPFGTGSVRIDGYDVSDRIRALRIDAAAGRETVLELEWIDVGAHARITFPRAPRPLDGIDRLRERLA